MFGNIYLIENLFDFARFVNQKSSPQSSVISSAHKFLFAVTAVSVGDSVFGIDNQRERQFIFGYKFPVRIFVVCRDTENRDSFFRQIRKIITQRTRLFRAAGRVVFRIKIKNDFSPAPIGKFDRRARLVVRLKIRRVVAYL